MKKIEQNGKAQAPLPEEVAEVLRMLSADSDVNVQFEPPPDSNIEVLGRPILALDPVLNNGTLPAKFLQHRLIQNRYFFALPRDLWDQIYNRLGKDAFDNDLVDLEVAAAEMCGDCSWNVGFHSGGAFTYPLLRSSRRRKGASNETETTTSWGLNRAQLDFALKQCEARLGPLRIVSRGYLGWLLTCRQFLEEHDALMVQWSDMVRRWGFTRLGVLVPKGMFVIGDDPTTEPKWPAYSQAFEEFFTRWRLRGMAAPYLPIPLEPLMAGEVAVSLLPQLARAGGVFCLPDTFPIPSRDELRNLLEGALHGGEKPAHLAEWMELIAKDNMGKKPIARFARLFEFQHYYRILNHRHAPSLRRKTKALKEVLAHGLDSSEKSIVGDLGFVRRRLGKHWLDRGQFSIAGPF